MQYVLILTICATSIALAQEATGGSAPKMLAPSEDTVQSELRQARAKYFNVRGPSMIEPNEAGFYPSLTVKFAIQDELPYSVSHTVFLGELIGVQPFLSFDKKGIYREYAVKVLDSIKTTSPVVLSSGDMVTILRRGGALRLSDGRVVKHDFSNDIVPLVGQRYLFFLTYESTIQGFHQLKLWHIRDGKLVPLYPDDIGRLNSGESAYAGKAVSEVLIGLKAKN